MKILFANHSLTRFGGTEVVIRDLGLKLMARGHEVAVYSSRKVSPGASLADVGIQTTNRLNNLPFIPDLIHGQHAMETMTAVIGLPGVPAVYCCHGATRFDAQPRHPRIVLYTAMSGSMKIRMAVESNIPEDMIEVVHNAVDLDRFRIVREATERPRRALVYNRMASARTLLGSAIVKAAELRGIEVDFSRSGEDLRTIRAPEDVLVDYDIVFASGKSAIDALACGCAVIVISGTANGWAPAGLGDLVTPENFHGLRAANFAAPVNAPPATASTVGAEMDKYDRQRVRETGLIARSLTDLDEMVDRYLSIYGRAIERAPAAADKRAERDAAHHYLRSLTSWMELAEQRRTEMGASSATEAVQPPSRVANGLQRVEEGFRALRSTATQLGL